LTVRSAILATAWLLVFHSFSALLCLFVVYVDHVSFLADRTSYGQPTVVRSRLCYSVSSVYSKCIVAKRRAEVTIDTLAIGRRI